MISVDGYTIDETKNHWVVKTPNYAAEPVDTVHLPNVNVNFGKKNNKVVIRSFEYNRDKYSLENVTALTRQKLLKCPRCKYVSETRVGEKNMAAVRMQDVGYNALLGIIGGTSAMAIHFLGYAPVVDAQAQWITGVPNSSLVGIVAGVVAVAGGLYYRDRKYAPWVLFAAGATLLATSIAKWAGWLAPPPPAARLRRALPITPPKPAAPRIPPAPTPTLF